LILFLVDQHLHLGKVTQEDRVSGVQIFTALVVEVAQVP